MSYSPTQSTGGSALIGDTNTYSNFTPLTATVKGDFTAIDLALASIASKANQSLSNLTNPTAVNQNIIFATGSAAILKTQDSASATQNLTVNTGNSSGNISGNYSSFTGTTPVGGTTYKSGDYSIGTGNGGQSGSFQAKTGSASNTGADSGSATLATGNSLLGNSGNSTLSTGSVVNGNAGNVVLQPGIASGSGINGKIVLFDSSVGTIGYVWTSTDTVGGGAWMASGGGGANTHLSNLSAVQFNTNLIPDTDGLYDLGSASKEMVNIYAQFLTANGGASVDLTSGQLNTSAHRTAIAWNSYALQNFSGDNIFNWHSLTFGTAGQVLSTDGAGALSWITSSGGGATTSLNNLTPTAIQQSLILAVDNTFDLGSSGIRWSNLYAYNIDTLIVETHSVTSGIGTLALSANSAINILPGAGAAISLQLFDDAGTGSVGFIAPSTVTSPYTLIMPPTDGTAGQTLATNGSGTLSWVTSGGSSFATAFPVDAAAPGNINIASAPSSIDGVAPYATTLLNNQNDPTENGVYDYNGTGSPLTRNVNWDTAPEFALGKQVFVLNGATLADVLYVSINPVTTLGTDAPVFQPPSNPNYLNRNFSNVSPAVVDINMNSNRIHNLTDPSAAQDAATQNYVDNAAVNTGFTNMGITGTAGNVLTTDGGSTGSFTSPFINLPQGSSDPVGIVAGSVYFNTISNKMKIYNGTTWETVTSV